MKIVLKWWMRALLAGPVVALPVAALAQVPVAGAVAGELVVASDDSEVVALGDGALVAVSESDAPAVTFAGQTVRIRFEAADASGAASAARPDDVTFEVEVSRGDARPMESLSLNFTKITYTTMSVSEKNSAFDGRLLTARDLARDQGYVLDVARAGEGASGFAGYDGLLFNGGIFVGVASFDAGGVAALRLAKAPDGATTAAARRSATGGQWIEVTSMTWGSTTTATLPDGRTLAFDRLVLRAKAATAAPAVQAAAHGLSMTGVPAMRVVVVE